MSCGDSPTDLVRREPFDHVHRAPAVGTHPGGQTLGDWFRAWGRWAVAKDLLATWEQLSPVAIREKPKETDADESPRQHVQEEPAQARFAPHGHRPRRTAVGVGLPPEGHVAVGHVDNPVIRDGHAVRVAREILQPRFGSAEGAFGVDDPVVTKERAQERVERVRVGQVLEAPGEGELTLPKGPLQARDELAAKHAA